MLASLLYVTLGLLLVLVLRKPSRRLFGASAAFSLWLLPPVFFLLPQLPLAAPPWISAPVLRVFPSGATGLLNVVTSSPDSAAWLWRLWLAGSIVGLLRLQIHYILLARQARTLPAAMQQALLDTPMAIDMRRLRLHPAGPAVLWAPRSIVLLPPDFLDRFGASQRQLVLRHEQMHLRRGDALWSLLAELCFALLWFHPLAWLALPRLRLDQELACDECVLRHAPDDEAGYAHTLLHSTGMDVMPVLIPWLAQPQLKERLRMIQSHRPGAVRRRSGFVVLAALMASSACVVQAATHQRESKRVEAATRDMRFNNAINPVYPASARKNHEQGTVVLDILVGVDGKPISFTVNKATKASPDLVKAASDAAMQWRFIPQIKNGKPIQSYARIPVNFALDEAPKTPPAAIAPKSA
jgi:TonB family protein